MWVAFFLVSNRVCVGCCIEGSTVRLIIVPDSQREERDSDVIIEAFLWHIFIFSLEPKSINSSQKNTAQAKRLVFSKKNGGPPIKKRDRMCAVRAAPIIWKSRGTGMQ